MTVIEAQDAAAAGTALPVLYTFRRCPYALRARLAIAVAAVPCALREVMLRDKPAALIATSPKATVPVLVDTDVTVLDQSLDIMRWALRRNDPHGWLQCDDGTGTDGASGSDRLIAECDGPFKHHLDRYKYAERYRPVPSDMLEQHQPDALVSAGTGTNAGSHADVDTAVATARLAHHEAAAAFIDTLEQCLAVGGFLGGTRYRLADMAIAPFVRQFAATEAAWFEAQRWPRVQRWLGDWQALPLFAQAMKKFAPWHEGDAVTVYGLSPAATPH